MHTTLIELEIFDYGMNGEGIAKQDGKIVLVPHTLIGEKVTADIVEDNKNYCVAKLNKIITKNSHRTIPACPYFYECGGCDLQHMDYSEQLKFKQLLIKKTLKKICNVVVDVKKTVACNQPFEYRNKISINAQNNLFGFYKKDSKNLINVEQCMLANNKINSIYSICKEYCNNNNLSIKHIVIRDINDQTLVGIVSSKELNLSDLFTLINKQFVRIGLYNIINTRNDSVVLSGKTIHIGGIKQIEITNFNLTYSVDLLGFHQTNLEIQDKLYQDVLNYIGKNSVVVNGFSGQGLLSAILSKKAKQVVGIEINASAHNSAEKLKATNKLTNLTNIKADFNKAIDKYKNADILILDPAKKGCGKDTMQKVIGIKEIIYISCNPIALCKDLNVILSNYDIIEVTPFDMFPNTKNVETIVKLKLKENQI